MFFQNQCTAINTEVADGFFLLKSKEYQMFISENKQVKQDVKSGQSDFAVGSQNIFLMQVNLVVSYSKLHSTSSVMRLSELWNNSQPGLLASERSFDCLRQNHSVPILYFVSMLLTFSLFKSYRLAKENTIQPLQCIQGSMSIFNALCECYA